MMPQQVSQRTVADRLALIDECLSLIRSLPIDDAHTFLADRRNLWAAESRLRRALEALHDIGRHILARGLGIGVTEYKEVATQLGQQRVLTPEAAQLLFTMAGYRNRMVHFYHEITPSELLQICAAQLGDIERVAGGYRQWLADHPERVGTSL